MSVVGHLLDDGAIVEIIDLEGWFALGNTLERPAIEQESAEN